MNEGITIEQQLLEELSRLKKAIDYIEQAEKSVQQVQQLYSESQSKYGEVLKSSENLNSTINAQIFRINRKVEQIITDLDLLSKRVAKQNEAIEQNQIEIDRQKKLRWYQTLFGKK